MAASEIVSRNQVSRLSQGPQETGFLALSMDINREFSEETRFLIPSYFSYSYYASQYLFQGDCTSLHLYWFLPNFFLMLSMNFKLENSIK